LNKKWQQNTRGFIQTKDYSDATNEIRKGLRKEMNMHRENGKYSTSL